MRTSQWKRALKATVRRAARTVGLDVRRYVSDIEVRKLRNLRRLVPFDLVLDIGANTGQFVRKLRDSGYRGSIVSFEPLSAAYAELCESAARDRNWTIAPRAAIGATNGAVELNVAANSYSSSALPMLDAHLNAAPESRYIGAEKVPMARLDSIAAPFVRHDSTIFMKIDTQGYEWNVLDGAEGLMPQVQLVQVELSLVPLYAGQPLLGQMYDRLRAAGFEWLDLVPGFEEQSTGRLLQLDGIFRRTEH